MLETIRVQQGDRPNINYQLIQYNKTIVNYEPYPIKDTDQVTYSILNDFTKKYLVENGEVEFVEQTEGLIKFTILDTMDTGMYRLKFTITNGNLSRTFPNSELQWLYIYPERTHPIVIEGPNDVIEDGGDSGIIIDEGNSSNL
jgi:hypothetical protein